MKIRSDVLVDAIWAVCIVAAMMLFVALTSCAGFPKPKPPPTPVLRPEGTRTMDVQFVGVPYERADLFVCGKVASVPLSCVEYSYFQEQLRRAGR